MALPEELLLQSDNQKIDASAGNKNGSRDDKGLLPCPGKKPTAHDQKEEQWHRHGLVPDFNSHGEAC